MPFKDPARKHEYQRDWVRRNAERHREHSRAGVKRWRERHPDEHRAYRRRYHAENALRLNAKTAEWHREHPEVRIAVHHRRRAREAAGGSFSAAEWLALVAEYHHCCGYCGLARPLQPDHRTPLKRGGPNLIANIIPVCGPCNRRKGTLTEEEFRRRIARDPT
ncbi:MAG TPA: HNH endonuclease signature motif containing protein [Candidatus Limnocylindria bacterium]